MMTRRQHIAACVWLFWPITLLVLVGLCVLVASVCWHNVTYTTVVPHCYFAGHPCVVTNVQDL